MKNFLTRLIFLVFCFCPLAASAQNFSSTQPLTRTLNISAAAVVKPSQGVLTCFNVIVVGTGTPGTINDVATIGAVAAANQMATIPLAVGNYCVTFPFFNGLAITPSSTGGQVIAVSYQ